MALQYCNFATNLKAGYPVMKRIITLFSILTVFCLPPLVQESQAQLQGVNLNSLQNLTGMNQLYNLIPQVVGQGQLTQLGMATMMDPNAAAQTGVPDQAALDEQQLYYMQQLRGVVFDAVLDSLKGSTELERDTFGMSDIFGHQFFQKNNLNLFASNERIKAPANYTLDVGDELSISVWGASVYNANVEIEEDGYISIPDGGRVYLKGVTYGASKELIKRRISTFIDTRSSNMEIVLNYSRNITVNIVGDVKKPGAYVIPAINSVF